MPIFAKHFRTFFNRLLARSSVETLVSQTNQARDSLSHIPSTALDYLLNESGVFKSSNNLKPEHKREAVIHFDFKERAEVAMCVAQMFPGGDYFEFGSDGMGTFRNFLTAFDLTGLNNIFPTTNFYAFDIFGNMEDVEDDIEYFKNWHDSKRDRYADAISYVSQHGLFMDRCQLVKGYFKNTLTPEFKKNYLKMGGAIGFAFLDCNITNSYSQVFEFLRGTLKKKAFVYMDEYYYNDDVPSLFSKFCSITNVEPQFIRSAGAFGALYRIRSIT